MKNPKQYLMEKIVGYQTNGFSTFGQLHAKHTDDIIKLMTEFAEETVLDVIGRINNGENVLVKDISIGRSRSSTAKKSK